MASARLAQARVLIGCCAVSGAHEGAVGARPEALARERLVHQAQHRRVAVEQADEGAPHRPPSDEGSRAVDRVDDPTQPRIGARRPVLLADEAVLGPAGGDGRRDHPLGRLVGFGDGIEGARRCLVVDGQRRPEVWADDRPRGVGQGMGEIDEVRESRLRLICHSIAPARR